MPKKYKPYFFYTNTEEYRVINNGLDWSILAIIYSCIFHFCIEYDIDFILNTIIAISIGYIISYFYFIMITIKERNRKEECLLKILCSSIVVYFEYSHYVDNCSIYELKNKYKNLYTHMLFVQESFSDVYVADIKFKTLIDIIRLSTDNDNQTKDIYIRTNGYMLNILSSIIYAFKDWEKIISELKKDKNNKMLIEIVEDYISLLESKPTS